MSKQNQFFAFSNEILKLNECYFLYNEVYKLYIKNTDNRLFESSLYLLTYPLIIILCNFYQGIQNLSVKSKVENNNYIRIHNILNLIDDDNIRTEIIKKIDNKVIDESKKLFVYRDKELAHIDKKYIQNNFKDTITLKIIKDIDFEMLISLLNEIFDIITVSKYDTNYYNEKDSLGLDEDFENLKKIFNAAIKLRNNEYKNLLKENPNVSKGFFKYEIKNKFF